MKEKNVTLLQASFRLAGMLFTVFRHDYFKYMLETWIFIVNVLLSKF